MSTVGLLDPVLSDLRRRKLDVINRLHNLGMQRDIDLPSLIVIGSQSAGKSSLIESISGINLPRASGTCTRCPTECRLIKTSASEPWQCTVSLRFLTDETNQPLETAKNIQFGSVITTPRDVEERLKRAQLAILNPSIDPQVFLNNYQHRTLNSLNFSSNTVCLEIKGPDLTDLSFYDLPGLIASVTDGGRDEDVDEVRELVSTYIRKPSCIILLTVACEVDFETQGAYRLAKSFDPEGIRTIGVLTKPDRIPEGEHERWLKLIRNQSSPLQNGWFCVKQLSSAEMGKNYSFEESRTICENFFRAEPWSSLDPTSQNQLGTRAVTAKLNEFLMEVIAKRIPEIMQEIQLIIQKTREELHALPPPPSSDPVFELMRLVNQFCDAANYQSEGIYLKDSDSTNKSITLESDNQFVGIRLQQKKFRNFIHRTAPMFTPYARNAVLRPQEVYSLQRPNGYVAIPQVTPQIIPRRAVTPSKDECLEIAPMYLDDVSNIITSAITRELPDFFPFHVVQRLITIYTEKWRQPAFDLVDDIFRILVAYQTQLVQRHFGQHTTGRLYATVRNLVHGYMQSRKESLERKLEWILQLESSAFTLNDSMLSKYKKECLEKYRQIRSDYFVNDEQDASELTVMATVEAYFEVAYVRFVDNIPLAIDHELVRVDKRSLEEVLCKGLKLTDPLAKDTCARFMAEPTQRSHLRRELASRLERLTTAQQELMNF